MTKGIFLAKTDWLHRTDALPGIERIEAFFHGNAYGMHRHDTYAIGCTIAGISVGAVMRTIWPFYGALIVALGLVTYVPSFSMWLPNLILKTV